MVAALDCCLPSCRKNAPLASLQPPWIRFEVEHRVKSFHAIRHIVMDSQLLISGAEFPFTSSSSAYAATE